MATATMTAAGAAALLYYTLSRRLQEENSTEVSSSSRVTVSGSIQAPATWLETVSTLSETLRFTYSETLGKWPIGDLAFGITYLLKRQGNLHVASVFSGKDHSVQLRGPHVTRQLKYLLKLLISCWHFSKKPFPQFLEETGYSHHDVLLQEPKAGILKPAFTILADEKDNCIYLLVRGTRSIKDTLTAATGAVVPFHHTILREGGVTDLVLGYAHAGMVAAARWIAKLAAPCLIKALAQYKGYQIKIVGHSLGGGTAALLTYALREHQELSTATCVTFAPAACMTWELAESSKDFITSVVNGADLVPTFSAASVDDLRSEVTASAWLNDLRNQIEQTRILSTVYRSASALGSRLPSIASAKEKVVGAEGILRPVSNGTWVVINSARNVAQAAWTRPALSLSSWSCMGVRHGVTATSSTSEEVQKAMDSTIAPSESAEPLLTSEEVTSAFETMELPVSTHEGTEWTSESQCSCSDTAGIDGEDDQIRLSREKELRTEVELLQQIEQGVYEYQQEEGEINEVVQEITEEEKSTIAEVDESSAENLIHEMREKHRFYPPGKIMHLINLHLEGRDTEEGTANPESTDDQEGITNSGEAVNEQPTKAKVGIFLTDRSLYGKLRLTQTMISDHFMPVYRRQIEQLIIELEKDESHVNH